MGLNIIFNININICINYFAFKLYWNSKVENPNEDIGLIYVSTSNYNLLQI